jgi:hypothetical protein
MNKEQRNTVVEYTSTLSEEDLRWLTQRLSDRLVGDLPEALNYMSHSTKMDQYLGSANNSWELYDACDRIRDICTKECKRRGLSLKQ